MPIGIELDSYQDIVVQDTVDSNGAIAIDCGGPIVGHQWLLDHIAIQCNSLTIPFCTVYAAPDERHIYSQYIIDYTDTGNNDIAEYPQAQLIDIGEHLVIQWQGVSPLGAPDPKTALSSPSVASARVVFRDVRSRVLH